MREKKNFYLPDQAQLVFKYDVNEGVVHPNIWFDPSQYLLPEDYQETKFHGAQIVYPLFSEEYHYGFMLIGFGGYETFFYQTVYEILSKEIITSINISRENKEKKILYDQNLTLEDTALKLKMLSYTDELTKRLNRRGFYELGKVAIEKALKKGLTGLVFYVDMDGLKSINDTYGHEAGDRAINYEASILHNVFRDTDVIGRLGGDEFAVVAPGMPSYLYDSVCQSIENECNKINMTKNEPFRVSMSVGSYEFSKETADLETVLKRADKAQYVVKKAKKDKYRNLES